MDYLVHLLVLTCLFGMLSLSLNVASGFTQLLSVAHAGFFGVGAYTAAILSTQLGTSLVTNLVCGMVLAGIVALPLAWVALRTVEDYFIMCTLGFAVVLHAVMNNWISLTHGPMGIVGIAPPSLFGRALGAEGEWLVLAGCCCLVMYWVARNLKRSPLGHVLRSIAADEIYCASLGKDVAKARLQSFVLGAMLAAIPGVLYAQYISYISPSSFTVSESIFILSIVIAGGLGSLPGGLVATAVLIFLPEALRFTGMSSDIAANVRQMLFGAAIVLLVGIRRAGLRVRDSSG